MVSYLDLQDIPIHTRDCEASTTEYQARNYRWTKVTVTQWHHNLALYYE